METTSNPAPSYDPTFYLHEVVRFRANGRIAIVTAVRPDGDVVHLGGDLTLVAMGETYSSNDDPSETLPLHGIGRVIEHSLPSQASDDQGRAERAFCRRHAPQSFTAD